MNRPIHLFTTGTLFALLSFTSTVEAQNRSIRNRRSPKSLSSLPLSREGKPIICQFSDPFLSSEQVESVADFLRKPYAFDWDASTTIEDVHQDLSKHLPVELNDRALEEIGLAPDDPFSSNAEAKSNRFGESSDSRSDPFADMDSNESQDDSLASVTDSPKRWWDSSRRTSDSKIVVTNGAKLLYLLGQLDLTLDLHHGQLQITTIENAEMTQCVRIYDVTPLVAAEDPLLPQPNSYSGPGGSLGFGMGGFGMGGFGMGGFGTGGMGTATFYTRSPSLYELSDFQSLMDLIQTSIVPDTWEALGGPSTMAPYSTRRRSSLIVSAPLITQLQIEDLLNRLNR